MRRANGRANGRVGGKPRAMRDIVKAFRRPHRFAHCRFACPTGTAVSQGFRAASRMASDVPHRRATRSWPKALGNRLYGSLSTLLGISRRHAAAGHVDEVAAARLERLRVGDAIVQVPAARGPGRSPRSERRGRARAARPPAPPRRLRAGRFLPSLYDVTLKDLQNEPDRQRH